MNAEELYYEYEKLPVRILHKTFKRPNLTAIQKRLTYDDLLSFCRMGLWRACREYDHRKNVKFTSFAINHIRWSLFQNMRKESAYCRRYVDEKRLPQEENEVNFINLDGNLYEGEEDKTYHEICPSDVSVINDVVGNLMYENITSKLTIRQRKILKLRMKEFTHREIGKKLKVSKETVRLELIKMKDIVEQYYEQREVAGL